MGQHHQLNDIDTRVVGHHVYHEDPTGHFPRETDVHVQQRECQQEFDQQHNRAGQKWHEQALRNLSEEDLLRDLLHNLSCLLIKDRSWRPP